MLQGNPLEEKPWNYRVAVLKRQQGRVAKSNCAVLAYSTAHKRLLNFCSTAPKEVPEEWGSEASYTIDGDDSGGGVPGSLCCSASCFAERTASWSGILCMKITMSTSGVLALLGLHPGHIHHSTGDRRAGSRVRPPALANGGDGCIPSLPRHKRPVTLNNGVEMLRGKKLFFLSS